MIMHAASVLLIALVLMAGAVDVRAQQFSGKISGRVTDVSTGEALPGVNVVIEGTTLGAATDARGRYDILRVPPGTHTVIVSFIGYQTTRVEDVRVSPDRTTDVDVRLREELFEGEEVIITADRPPVVRDRTSTSTDYGAREIEAAPVEGLRGLLGLTAGVERTGDGNFSIRGGGAYEISFLVNGVEQVMSNSGVPGYSFAFEKANNSWKYDVNPLGVEAMEVISGGFSAEYGNAQSGVVKLATKEGGQSFEGEYRIEYRAPGQYHWGPYLYGAETLEWKEWGALENWIAKRDAGVFDFLNDKSDENIQRLHALWLSNHMPTFVPNDTVFTAEGGVLYLPGQEVPNRLGVYDYRKLPYTRHLIGFGGPLGADAQRLRFHVSGELRNRPTRIPTVEQIQTYGNLTFTTSFQPFRAHKFRFTTMYQHYEGGLASGADDIRWAGRDGLWKYTLDTDSPREEVTTSQTLNWTWAIDAQSFLEAQIAHSFEQYRVVNRPVVQRTDPWSIQAGPWDGGFRTVFSFTTFYQQDTRTRFLDGSVGYTRQVSPNWQFKGGMQLRRWHTMYSGVSSRLANVFIAGSGYGEYYDAYPTYGAAYVQNKLEFEGLVANIGLRLDGYNYNMDVPTNRFNPFYPGTQSQGRGEPGFENSDTFLRLSPRLGLSFPVGELTAFRLHYGHFSSMPQFRNALMRSTELGWRAYGNANLKPEKTISYEVGIQQALDSAHRLDLVGYYNDRVSQVGLLRIVAPSATIRDRNNAYTSYANNAYGATYGIEATVERYDGAPVGYRFAYTLSRSTIGSFGPSILYSDDPDDPRNFTTRQRANEALAFGDRTHRFNAFLSYRVDTGHGPRVLGIYPLENTTVGVIYTASSGTPYIFSLDAEEYRSLIDASMPNRRYPFEEQVDLNLNRAITIGGTDVSLGVRITNLLNHRWLTPMAARDDLELWTLRNITLEDPVVRRNGAVEHRDTHYFNYFQAYRNVPREVYFSLGLRFR
jgi:hypothetical protein